MKDWLVSLAIAGIGALVNIGINLLIYAMYMGRHLEKIEKSDRMVEEHDREIAELKVKLAAATGVANGVDFRRRKGD
jgi:hypothetical protein